jgi:hypothetical protein
MTALLLLLVAALAPWIVHLAPPRQRPLALVGVVGVFLLFGIFTNANPITAWESWVGLAAGVISVVGLSAAGGTGGPRRPVSRRGTYDDDAGSTA